MPTITWREQRAPVATGVEAARRSSLYVDAETEAGKLEREAEALGGYAVVVDRSPHPAPADGWLPGVAVWIASRWGWLRYACATWSTWESNLEAITDTLYQLRMIERTGVLRGEQYQASLTAGPDYQLGAATPPGDDRGEPVPEQDPEAAREDAAQLIARQSRFPRYDAEQDPPGWRKLLESPVDVRMAHEKAMGQLRPDSDTETIARVNAARTLLLDWHADNGKRLTR